jgi:RNA 3'-terminal phosphate cyclase (ATP)
LAKEKTKGCNGMIRIDGSKGEGGGQILRTALSLSMATGQAFTLENIRAGRAKPGLMRQHLACVRAAAEISGALVEGADIASTHLIFKPGAVQAGQYRFDIGTAGSTMLVLQTVLPVLMLCDQPSTITVTGGTHNHAAPCFDFIDEAYLPLLGRLGMNAKASCVRRGFYPAGGGEVLVDVKPATELKALNLSDRGELVSTSALAVVANLPFDIAQREAAALARMLNWPVKACVAQTDAKVTGTGNVLMARVEHQHVTEIFTGLGRQRVSSEQVARELAEDVQNYLAEGAAVGMHLADQLLLPMVLARGGAFTIVRPTLHFYTNVAVIYQFIKCLIKVEHINPLCWRVEVSGV